MSGVILLSVREAEAIADRIRPGHREVSRCICGQRTEVIDSRHQPDGTIRRHRRCVASCGARVLVTVERVEREVLK